MTPHFNVFDCCTLDVEDTNGQWTWRVFYR